MSDTDQHSGQHSDQGVNTEEREPEDSPRPRDSTIWWSVAAICLILLVFPSLDQWQIAKASSHTRTNQEDNETYAKDQSTKITLTIANVLYSLALCLTILVSGIYGCMKFTAEQQVGTHSSHREDAMTGGVERKGPYHELESSSPPPHCGDVFRRWWVEICTPTTPGGPDDNYPDCCRYQGCVCTSIIYILILAASGAALVSFFDRTNSPYRKAILIETWFYDLLGLFVLLILIRCGYRSIRELISRYKETMEEIRRERGLSEHRTEMAVV